MLDIGGGFPATYTKPVPENARFGESIREALEEELPYELDLVAEPGRFLVAGAGVMVTRDRESVSLWRPLGPPGSGAFNAMLESLQPGTNWSS